MKAVRRMFSRTFHVTLVRHGETMANRDRIMQGQKDTELSDLGHQQAALVGAKLQNVHFSHMYSSPLCRAADTAKAIVSANTVSTGSLVMDTRLKERGFGCLEGKPLTEFFRLVEETGIPSSEYTPEGGETIAQVAERAASFVTQMCTDVLQPDDTPVTESQSESNSPSASVSSDTQLPNCHILVVSHGLLLRELRLAMMKYYHDEMEAGMEEEVRKISPNTGVSQFVMSASRSGKKLVIKVDSVLLLNDNSHLTQNGKDLTTQFKGAL